MLKAIVEVIRACFASDPSEARKSMIEWNEKNSGVNIFECRSLPFTYADEQQAMDRLNRSRDGK